MVSFLSRYGYQSGVTVILEVLNAQSALSKARDQRIQALTRIGWWRG